ncbi:MAG: MFS transporter [Candidatus Dormibacteria bacterium]
MRPPVGPPRGPAARFFTAVFLSLYGDWLTTVALLVVLYELTHSPAAPAGYMVARVAPRVLGPWIGGNLSDRFSPRRVIVGAAILQAVVTASLIASHRAGLIWAIYLAVAVAQFIGALARPSQGALLPSLVSDRQLARANATYGLFFSTSIFVAPAIGAVLLVRVGPDPLFAIDAASFAVSALLIATLPRGERRDDGTSTPSTARIATAGALRMALRRPEIRMVAAANFASGLTVTVTQALLVVAAHERFGGDAVVGYLYSAVGVGGLVGGLIALRWIPARGWTRLGVFVAITIELVALAGFSALTLFLAALLVLALSAGSGSSLDTWGITEIQRRAPPGLMGRYNSIIFIAMYSGMLIGALWALGTASVLHWDVAIQISCAAMLLLLGGVWLAGGGPDPVAAERTEP